MEAWLVSLHLSVESDRWVAECIAVRQSVFLTLQLEDIKANHFQFLHTAAFKIRTGQFGICCLASFAVPFLEMRVSILNEFINLHTEPKLHRPTGRNEPLKSMTTTK